MRDHVMLRRSAIPLTPYHLGPGLLMKAILRGAFSLMVFGWTQALMDLQPLIVLISGRGELHGFTHTYLGATLIGLVAAVSGKPLFEWILSAAAPSARRPVSISWRTALISAALGSYSHVILDSVMHPDVHPLAPMSSSNPLPGLVSLPVLHDALIYSGVAGIALYLVVSILVSRR